MDDPEQTERIIEQAMIEIHEAVTEAMENLGQAIAGALEELSVLQLRIDLDNWHLTE